MQESVPIGAGAMAVAFVHSLRQGRHHLFRLFQEVNHTVENERVKGTGSPEVPPRRTHRPAMRVGNGTS
jgi:hypothetical protein